MSNDEREREIGKAVLRARDAQTTIERLSQTLARHADHLQQIAERIAFTVKGTEQRLFASDEVKRLGEGVAYPETFHGNPNSTSEYGLEIPYPSYAEISQAIKDITREREALQKAQQLIT